MLLLGAGARGALCLAKHSLQYTGLPAVGLNGTVAVLPQSLHFISVETPSDMLVNPINS